MGFELKDNRLTGGYGWDAVQRYDDTTYARIPMSLVGTVHNRIASAFVQDSWALTGRMRVNAGMRWEGEYFVDSNGNVAQSIPDEWQPRIGIQYELGPAGTQRVLGSAGRFYEEVSTLPILYYYSDESTGGLIFCRQNPLESSLGCDTLGASNGIQPRTSLNGQYYDECTLGYDRVIAEETVVGVRGIARALGQAIEDGVNPETGAVWFGNPGRGNLAAFPRAKREYRGLEFTLQYSPGAQRILMASYVLSRNRGNYPGLFNSDFRAENVNVNYSFDMVTYLKNSFGLLPNDRTHVFKVAGSYPIGRRSTAGASFVWQSGTPLSEFSVVEPGGSPQGFLRQRGSIGRTPAIWDLDLRFQYELLTRNLRHGGGGTPKIIVDVFHVASPRKAVDFDQIRYLGMDAEGNATNANPNYLRATRYQPPMAVRLGVEVGF
jgi:hypothetical protein